MKNQKGISSILIILIIVGVLVIGGGIWYWQKSNVYFPPPLICSQKTKVCPDGTIVSRIGQGSCGEFAKCPEQNMIPTNASVNGPLDTALAEVTVLSMDNRIASLRIEKIQDYIRYPNAKYAQLKVNDVINVKIYDFVASSSDPTVGKKYLANMSLCITNYYGGLSCQYDGWSAALYPGNTDETADWKTYRNEEYGFTLTLADDWQGYTVTTTTVEYGGLVTVRHPQWSETNPRMDIPILVYPIDQWKKWESENFETYPTAAPIGPTERGRNNRYVFATAPRYNYSFATGWEEVETIIKTLQGF